MKLFNQKKASLTWEQIVLAIIAVIVVILIIVWFRSSGGKGFDFASGKVGELGDCDKDGVADMFDKCPCDSSIGDKFPKDSLGKETTTTCAKTCTGNKDSDCVK